MPMVTYARIISGMINDRNWLKNDESVTTKRQKPSGRNWPNRMPTMMAMMSLGSNPSLNFFFSSISFFLLFGGQHQTI